MIRIQTVWGDVKIIALNLERLCINGFVIPLDKPLDKPEEYVDQIPTPNEDVVKTIIEEILEEKDFVKREETEFSIDCGEENYGQEIKAFWKIHFEVVNYHGPQRCEGFREIGQKFEGKDQMYWTNGSFDVLYPRFSLKKELEYLTENKLFFNGDSATRDSYVGYFYQRIKQISNKLGISNPKRKPNPKRRDLKLVKLRFTNTKRVIHFEIKKMGACIKVGKKEVNVPIHVCINTVNETLFFSEMVRVLGCSLEGIYE